MTLYFFEKLRYYKDIHFAKSVIFNCWFKSDTFSVIGELVSEFLFDSENTLDMLGNYKLLL